MHVVIVGNGIAGVTAARHVRKLSPARVTLVSDETASPYSRTALMYVYMGTLTQAHTHLYEERFWEENRIDRVVDRVERLDPAAQRLDLRDGGALGYDRLLVATGSTPVLPPWPGHDLAGVQGLYHLADLERLEAATPDAEAGVVVGGGLIGVELAEMLRVRGKAVTFLVREDRYSPRVLVPEESALVAGAIRAHGVDLRLGTEVARVEGGDRVEAVVTTAGDRVAAGVVGVGTGVRPNVGWLAESGLEVDRGVLVDEALRTSADGVFAAGDCAQLRTPPPGEPPTRPIWYTARLQGATAAFGLVDRPRAYAPGVFFNSAKFFDLEYQTYGAATGEPPDGEANWAVSDGRRSVRIQHRTDAGQAVVGVTSLGVRLRQAVCTRWVADGVDLGQARRELRLANFDPEFTRPLVEA